MTNPIELWLEVSKWLTVVELLPKALETHAAREGTPPLPPGGFMFDQALHQLNVTLYRWQQNRKPGPDVLLELALLRVAADLGVRDKERRDEGFARAKQHLLSTLDAWWEQLKQEHDKQPNP